MKKLVLAEKPSVARDIARVLGCKNRRKIISKVTNMWLPGGWDIW